MTEKEDVQDFPIMYVGIDPGKKNTGVALIGYADKQLTFLSSQLFDIGEEDFDEDIYALYTFIAEAGEEKYSNGYEIVPVIERFVPYKGVLSKNDEDILIRIGAIKLMLLLTPDYMKKSMALVRAIDWKVSLNKFLYKKGFRNPSATLDKRFSTAAAKHILSSIETEESEKKRTDHEDDAVCLAYLGHLFHTKNIERPK